jgi:hypothetical protein
VKRYLKRIGHQVDEKEIGETEVFLVSEENWTKGRR